MSDLHELTATEQLQALRSKEISSRDLTEHYLSRIEQLGPQLGAFVTVTAELAREEATRADQRRAGGEESALLGLPLGIKDLHLTAGVRTTLGSAALVDHVPAEDTWTVGRMRQAGAVLVGKTNASELGATCFTHDPVTGAPAVTPYDVTRYASGSSSGAAAAVAAGLVPFAHASDGAGSIRTPAATCHLVGVKPSRGLVSGAPSATFLSAGTEGPIARTVPDAALLLDVMAQPAPGDLYGWQPPESFARAVTVPPPRPLRVAVWTATGLADDPHPESVRGVQRAADLLRQLGHDVREVALPAGYDEQVRLALTTWFASMVTPAVQLMLPAGQQQLLTPYIRLLVDLGSRLSGSEVVLAQQVLARYASTFLAARKDHHVVLTPTTNGPPVPVGHFGDDPEGVADRMLAWSCYTPWVNLTGQPAVSLPSHLDGDGLPHAVHLVGRPRHDAELLALAAQLEHAGLWQNVHPPCWHQ